MSDTADWRDQRVATLEGDREEWKRLHDNLAVQLEAATERARDLARTCREQECQLRDLATRYERDVAALRAALAAAGREAVAVCYRMIADVKRLDESEFGEHAINVLRSVAHRIDEKAAAEADRIDPAQEARIP